VARLAAQGAGMRIWLGLSRGYEQAGPGRGYEYGGDCQECARWDRVFVATITNNKLKFQNPGIASLGEGIPLENENAIKQTLEALGIKEIHLVPNPNEETVLPDLAGKWVPSVVNGLSPDGCWAQEAGEWKVPPGLPG